MTVKAHPRGNVKLVAAVVGGSAMVAMAALTTTLQDARQGDPAVVGAGMNLGSTSTQTTPPATPETTIAVPVVKAKPYHG